MSPKLNVTGQRFGRLVVVAAAPGVDRSTSRLVGCISADGATKGLPGGPRRTAIQYKTLSSRLALGWSTKSINCASSVRSLR
jgi:hypothetical protein